MTNIYATYTALFPDEGGALAEATITSIAISLEDLESCPDFDDVEDVARWAVWHSTPAEMMDRPGSPINDTTPPSAVEIHETSEWSLTCWQLASAVDNGETVGTHRFEWA